jgi:hypothetical protein
MGPPVGGEKIEKIQFVMLIDPWHTGQIERSWKMGKT